MHLIEVRDGHLHVAVRVEERIAINNSLSWVLHWLHPLTNQRLRDAAGITVPAANELLGRIHGIGLDESVREGLWFSVDELRAIERIFAAILDGRIEIAGGDWELIGVDEVEFERARREIQRTLERSATWQPDRRAEVDRLREHARRDRESRKAAEEHWLTIATLETFQWLVEEGGYERELRFATRGGLVGLCYRSDHTAIRISASVVPQDPANVDVWLGPRGQTYCRLNQCLEAHVLDPVDLQLPHTSPRDRLVDKLVLASDALRALIPWEVGGNWNLYG